MASSPKYMFKRTDYFPRSVDTKDDRKSLDILKSQLEQLKKSSSSSSDNVKYKQLPLSSFCSTTSSKSNSNGAVLKKVIYKTSSSVAKARNGMAPVKKRPAKDASKSKGDAKSKNDSEKKKKHDSKSSNLMSGWLSKSSERKHVVDENKYLNKLKSDVETKIDNKGKQPAKYKKEEVLNSNRWITRSVPKPESKLNKRRNRENKKPEDDDDLNSGKKKKFKRNTSGSFEKYGIVLPTFEEVMETQKKYDAERECLEKLMKLADSQVFLKKDADVPKINLPRIVLDCKHLDGDDLNDAFQKNYEFVCDTFNGKRACKRHEEFNKSISNKGQNLNYNSSMVTFTYEQKEILLSKLHKEFDGDEDEFWVNNKYFFQVLLPEVCMKIFMDTHHLTYEEATTYLENRPV